jgi:hypothetical protein
MTKAIGPSFAPEIAAAGLAGLPFSWRPDGMLAFASSLSTTQIAAVEAVYAAHDPTVVPLTQQAAAILAQGVTVTSSSTLVPMAVWPIDLVTQPKMLAIATVLDTIGTFPNGGTVWPVRDMSGAVHQLTVAQFKAVQAACAGVAAMCDLVLDNLGTVLPSPTVSIA